MTSRVGLVLLLYIVALNRNSLSAVPIVPPATDCLYAPDLNGRVDILAQSLGASTANISFRTAILNAGLFPSAVGFGKPNVLYVASYLAVSSTNLATSPGSPFSQFITQSSLANCLPASMVIYDDVIFVGCSSKTNPYSIMSFSIADGDYGNFLSGLARSDSGLGDADITRLLYYNGSFAAPTFTYDGPALVALDTFYSTVSVMPLNFSRNSMGSLYLFAETNESFDITDEAYKALAIGVDGNLYVLRSFVQGGSTTRTQVLKFNGRSGTLEGLFINLPDGDDISLGPLGDFYIVGLNTFLSRITVYNSTGAFKYILFNISDSTLYPSLIYWAPCPPQEPSSGGDGTDSGLIIGLAVGLPIGGVLLFLLIVGLLAIILFLVLRRAWEGRRKEYDVENADEREMMGRRGTTRYTYREVDQDDLELGEMLGEGAFGKVYSGLWRGAPVAIKTFDKIKLAEADEHLLMEVREEAEMMQRLCNHPNVIKFVGAVTKPSAADSELYFSLITEFCPNGSLYDYLVVKKRNISLIKMIGMARDISAGILHLHKEKVIHRDIATRNVLLGKDNEVYLADFGMARLKQEDAGYTVSTVGPIKWMAPEAMLSKKYSEASDAFSYGVLLWEMVTRQVPWKGMDPAQIVLAVTRDNTRLKIPSYCDPVLKKIIKATWEQNPEKRMKMKEIYDRLAKYYKVLESAYSDLTDGDHQTSDKNEEEGSGGFEFSEDLGMAVVYPSNEKMKGKKKEESKRKGRSDEEGGLSYEMQPLQNGDSQEYADINADEIRGGEAEDVAGSPNYQYVAVHESSSSE